MEQSNVYVVTLYSEEHGCACDKRIVGVFTNEEKASKAVDTEYKDAKDKYGVEDDDKSVEYEQGSFFYIKDEEGLSVHCRITEVNVDEHVTDVYF